jgi:hypothetical protein
LRRGSSLIFINQWGAGYVAGIVFYFRSANALGSAKSGPGAISARALGEFDGGRRHLASRLHSQRRFRFGRQTARRWFDRRFDVKGILSDPLVDRARIPKVPTGLDQRANRGGPFCVRQEEEIKAVSMTTMQLIWTRTIPALDVDSLEDREAKEALFRDGDRYFLYLSDGAPAPMRRERLISLSSRQALIWLNENQLEAGSFWG